MPGSGCHRRPGLGRRDAGQRRDHDRAGLGLPPGVDDRSSVAAERIPVPAPRLRVDRLADRAQQPQAGQVVGVGNLAAPLHEHPDQRRRGVIDCDAVLFDDLEMPVLIRRVRRALVDHLGDAVGQRPVDDVGVAGDPADIGCAPIHVGLGLDVEHVVVRVGRLRQVAAGGVHDALGLAGGARRVEQEQRMLGVERLRRVLGRRRVDGVVPPQVAALGPRRVNSGAAHHQNVLDGLLRRRPPRRRPPSATPPARAGTARRW